MNEVEEMARQIKVKDEVYQIRMNSELKEKLFKIAEIEDDKTAQIITRLIKNFIKEYEKEHGEIKID